VRIAAVALVASLAAVLAPTAAAWTRISTPPQTSTGLPCCARAPASSYAESLALDIANYARVVFWSNATAFPGGGKTVKTSAAGLAKLAAFKRGTRLTVSAAGYAPASFKKP
jgi:hypothetical protein